MKRLKIIFAIIVSILLIIGIKTKIDALADDGEISIDSIPTHSGTYGKPYYHMTNQHMSNGNNVYCVEPGDAVRDDKWWLIKCVIRIDGDSVKFETYNSKGEATGNSYNGNSGIHNNILGAILCAEPWDYGPYASRSGNPLPKTGSQKSLNAYWNTWRSKSGAGDYGVASGGDGGYSLDGKYKDYANRTNYAAKIYFLQAASGSGYQNLILVDRRGSYDREPPEIDIPVTKKWSDNSNVAGVRPSSVTVRLYNNGSSTGKTLTLNSNNGWKGTFTGLDPDGSYSVKEDKPAGYTVSYSGNQDNGFTITNTLELTSVKVTKKWNDNNFTGRPSSVKVTLYGDGKSTGKTVTLSSSNSWTATFSNLPKYNSSGNAIKYTVQEEISNDRYVPSITGSASTGFVITNSLELTSVTVVKKWNDHSNRDNIRPASIKVTLYENGVATNKTVTLNEANNWTAKFEELYKNDKDGKPIVYTVKEDTVDGYVSIITGY